MSLTLRSIPYNYSVAFSRNEFLKLFPESFPARALEQDPSATEIEIPNRAVTPDALNALKYMVDNGQLPRVIPNPSYIPASNYLNIDILTVLADPDPTFLCT